MEENNFINSSTVLEKHWALDNPTTNDREETHQDKIVWNSLNEEINKRVKSIQGESTYSDPREDEHIAYLGNSDRLTRDEIFEIPKFSRDFLLSDKKYFYNAQRWLGHIVEIKDDQIIAKLNDLNNPTTFEIAEFEKKEVSPEDQPLVEIGASFYWSIGYSNYNGQIEKKSLIRFQRTIPWDESDVNIVVDQVDELYNNWKWE